jgi:glycosyltransferase involved in cell wall biosynthesis
MVVEGLSAVVIAQNSAATIGPCVESLAFAGEVVVVDGGSDDDTTSIAAAAGARVVVNPWPGFAAQRRFALEQCNGRWILSVDSDEEVSPALAAEIEAELGDPGDNAGFWIPRRNEFLGRWIDHGPWANDRVLRLFDRERAAVTERRVHEGVVVDGPTATLTQPLLHRTHRTIAESFDRLNRYTSLEARDRSSRRRVGLGDALFAPAGVFMKYYLLRGTWREGVHGLLLAAITAMYKSVLYVKTALLQRSVNSGD